MRCWLNHSLKRKLEKLFFRCSQIKLWGLIILAFFSNTIRIVEQCSQVLNNSDFVREINHSHIVLIPEVKHPIDVTDFRPISLCNLSYKIFTKSFANKLKQILSEIIFRFQSAFVLGRLITNNILVSYECINHILNYRKGEKA